MRKESPNKQLFHLVSFMQSWVWDGAWQLWIELDQEKTSKITKCNCQPITSVPIGPPKAVTGEVERWWFVGLPVQQRSKAKNIYALNDSVISAFRFVYTAKSLTNRCL